MADYVSVYTGLEIDAGIKKAEDSLSRLTGGTVQGDIDIPEVFGRYLQDGIKIIDAGDKFLRFADGMQFTWGQATLAYVATRYNYFGTTSGTVHESGYVRTYQKPFLPGAKVQIVVSSEDHGLAGTYIISNYSHYCTFRGMHDPGNTDPLTMNYLSIGRWAL